jgi:hypothetical protein
MSDWGYVKGRGVLTSSSENDSLDHCEAEERRRDEREIERRLTGFYTLREKTDERWSHSSDPIIIHLLYHVTHA